MSLDFVSYVRKRGDGFYITIPFEQKPGAFLNAPVKVHVEKVLPDKDVKPA